MLDKIQYQTKGQYTFECRKINFNSFASKFSSDLCTQITITFPKMIRVLISLHADAMVPTISQ